jgi:glucose/arabinose dehydrogenase
VRRLKAGGTAAALLATLTVAGCGDGDGGAAVTTAPGEDDGGAGAGAVALEEIGRFEEPVYVAQPESDPSHLYVVERCGRVVRVLAEGGGGRGFLDLSGSITCEGSEQGLLSVAFDPDYETSGLMYVYFTDPAGDARVVEYEADAGGNAADPQSARELLRVEDFASNHNGGQLQFGPDGLLYIGTGDGGGAGDPERTAQDLDSPLGKILRIDPSGGGEPAVVAYGLRNPWRFSFDRTSGDLWIGDVGQDSLEEVDAASAAQVATLRPDINFGWSAFEGTQRFNEDQDASGARPPVLEYPLGEASCAVTGGYVVRDRGVPPLLGRYVYGDYCAGELRSFSAQPALRGGQATDDSAAGLHVPALSSFGEDTAGHVYAVSLEGPVYRLVAE